MSKLPSIFAVAIITIASGYRGSAQTVSVISDGTRERPHCSWNQSPCTWTADVQTECAQSLCNASGYGMQGTFVSASNNPCTTSYVSGTSYFYLWTVDIVVYASYANDAQITANCIGTPAPTAPPPAPTPAPTIPVEGNLACGSVVWGSTEDAVSIVEHAAPDEVWTFAASIDGSYTFDTCGSSYDTYVFVYNRTVGNASLGDQVYSCDDCGGCGLQTVATMDLAAGSYFVIQSGYSTRSGTYVMNVSCPVGAYNWHPDPVQCGQTYRGSTGGQGGSQVGDGAPEDYYRVHAPYTGVYTFSTCGSGFDTYVHVYTIENATSSTLGRQVESCDDCGPCGTRTELNVTLVRDEWYVIVIDGYSTSSGTYLLNARCPTEHESTFSPTYAPTSTPTRAPIVVDGNLACGFNFTGTTMGAPSTVGHAAPDDYWTFAATVSGTYTFSTCGSSFNSWVYVYTRVGTGAASYRGPQIYSCDDCGPCGTQTVATMNLGVGNYYIVTSGSGTAAGDYRLAVTCPESAYNWHPEPMTCGTTYRGTTAGQGASQVGHEAPEDYYRIEATRSGEYVFSTCDSAYDTYLHVYNLSGSTSVTLLDEVDSCDDCGDCGVQTVLTVTLDEGLWYAVVVDGYRGSLGSYNLNVRCPITESPTMSPTVSPSDTPTDIPTDAPSDTPSVSPTDTPTDTPTDAPTDAPTNSPTDAPTDSPTDAPTQTPTTRSPTRYPTPLPTFSPTHAPTGVVGIPVAPTTLPPSSLSSSTGESTGSSSSSNSIIFIVAGCVGGCLLIVIALLLLRGRGGSSDADTRNEVAFENPMYSSTTPAAAAPYDKNDLYKDVVFDDYDEVANDGFTDGYLDVDGDDDI